MIVTWSVFIRTFFVAKEKIVSMDTPRVGVACAIMGVFVFTPGGGRRVSAGGHLLVFCLGRSSCRFS